ncbi:invasion associated locus B family protein [Rhizobium sp. KVB221]|uniref:Invasion associated locus B family protein n=1 Tax=Rhizobium setariae TaxID=2801340 RepID=A0A936YM10_9HYPH|nr:invasion associated locus B family protein [Rhizobium setariae]MBL0372974.1 invasion associated locus B family protein [Rhizobium setariae]
MSFEFKTAMRATVAAASFAAALVTAPGYASAQNAPAPTTPQGWFKICDKQDDSDVCSVRNVMTANTGQLVTAVALVTVSGKVNRKFMQVSVPPARLIPPGILMQIDGAKGQKLEYGVCMPDLCIAELPLTDGVIASLKKGNEVVFTSVNFQRMPNPIKISLEGFTGTFDGPAMEQSKLQERQRLLQEEMQKKADEARKKLQDAQNAAKQQ